MNKKQFYTNSVSGIIQLLFTALLTFICIPIFISKLGVVNYGIFAIISLIGNLTVFANLGFSTMLTKYLSEQGKCDESDFDILVTIVLMLIVISIPSFLIIYFNQFFLIKLFKIPIQSLAPSKTLYICLVFANIFLFLGQVSIAIIAALQKIYINNLLQFINAAIYWISIIIVVSLGYGLGEIGYLILASAIIWFVLSFVIAFKNWGKLNYFGVIDNFKRIVKKQLVFGSKIYVAGIVIFLFEPMTKLLISSFIGIKEVGYFDIAIKVKNQLQGVIARLFDPFFPFISQLKDMGKIKFAVIDIAQKYFLIAIPFTASLIFIVKPLLTLWLGNSNNPDIIFGCILIPVSYLLFSSSILPVYFFLISKGLAGKTIILHMSNAVVNASIIFLLYKKLGYTSVVLGISGGIFSSFLFGIYYQKKYLGIMLFESFNQLQDFLLSFIIIITFNGVYCYFESNIYLQVIGIVTITIILTIFTYRWLALVNIKDIKMYLGADNHVSDFLIKLFIKSKNGTFK